MTGAQIIETFKIYYDRITSFSAPGYEESEILTFLNNAQDELVRERTFGKNFRPPAIDDNEKRVAEIQPLLWQNRSGVTLSDWGDLSNAYYCSLGSSEFEDLLYIFDVLAATTRTAYPLISASEIIQCERIKSEDHKKFISGTLNRVHFVKPKFFSMDNNLIIMVDYYTAKPSALYITGVRQPYPITSIIDEFDGTYASTKMNLHPSVHQEIVDIAVRQALQVTQDPRWQTKMQEEQINKE